MLEINKKEDIIIPFDQIGDDDWKIRTSQIIEAIADNWDDELTAPVAADEISELENKLGTTLPESLSIFYQTFGLANIGEELQAFEDIGWLKDTDATDPEHGVDFTAEEQAVLPYLITFSDYLGNGNMFCFHSETKEIYYFDHDEAPYIYKMFSTVDDYIKDCLIFGQSDLFGENATQEEADQWTEEIVGEMIGKHKIRKWRYFDGWE
ncbi:hypothetical protein HDE68_002186 [Pedobacter cryoconitis]|uniref:Knr4/Smi1-like domain-containing protein n=1 Tax=Pedobacter cryoconitis TaxID=188932 RepID=A0A7W8ZM13_9SPHI|nr:SMI1/KNR4 family protein [Pedobacter cryoconitis]MBB5636298.1 hypothetical protein [Pedobacter cryoconitis]